MIDSPSSHNNNIVFLQANDAEYDGIPSPGIASKNRTIQNKHKQSDNMLNFSLDSNDDFRDFGLSTFCFSNKVSGFDSEQCSPITKKMSCSNGFKHSKFVLHKLNVTEKLADHLQDDWECKADILINKLLFRYKVLINRQGEDTIDEDELQNSLDLFFD